MKSRLNTPRSRILNFRLTTEELEALRAVSAARGSHCLSDFARAAVLGAARETSVRTGAVEHRIDGLEEKVAALCGSVLAALAQLNPTQPEPAPVRRTWTGFGARS